MKSSLICFQTVLTALVTNAAPLHTQLETRASWPDLPFKVSGRNILSASGSNVVYVGTNWPGHGESMLPEGLNYNSIENIVGLIKSLDMNAVRLTYAIEMIDDIYANSPDQTLEATLVKALGQENGTAVLSQILEHNPQFNSETTRLEVCCSPLHAVRGLMLIRGTGLRRSRSRARQTGDLDPPRQPCFES